MPVSAMVIKISEPYRSQPARQRIRNADAISQPAIISGKRKFEAFWCMDVSITGFLVCKTAEKGRFATKIRGSLTRV